jgi:glycosyltransferase involved in cell wall biosynthesis
MIRIAFPIIGGASWTGGQNYLLNLFGVLGIYAAAEIRSVLVVGGDVPADAVTPFRQIAGLEIVELPAALSYARIISRLNSVLVGRNAALDRWLRAQGVDVIFETAQFFGWRTSIPVLAWIPDFQHRHLPQMFSKRSWWFREIGYQLQVRAGRTIMLSSESSQRDCERFYPASRRRSTVVHFAVPASTTRLDPELLTRYKLPDEFIYLPNQFWKHKNHEVVIEAVALLKAQGKRVVVAASGNPSDNRHPGHFDSLMDRRRSLRIEEDFTLLGLIPRDDVRALMRLSVAVINPSLFEGWSTTVEEARSLNVPVILSDIAVHREQAPPTAVFFDPRSSKGAADAILAARERFAGSPRGEARISDPNCDARLACFAAKFCEAVNSAVSRSHQVRSDD